MKGAEKEREGRKIDTQKAKIFAYWYFILRDVQKAAEKAGEENGVLLLGERKVQTQLKRLRKMMGQETAGELAKVGLRRLLFSEPSTDESGNLCNGFALEKYSAGKGTEFKFWDKVKVCELLMKLQEAEQTRGKADFSGILGALQQGAAVLKEEGEEEE